MIKAPLPSHDQNKPAVGKDAPRLVLITVCAPSRGTCVKNKSHFPRELLALIESLKLQPPTHHHHHHHHQHLPLRRLARLSRERVPRGGVIMVWRTGTPYRPAPRAGCLEPLGK